MKKIIGLIIFSFIIQHRMLSQSIGLQVGFYSSTLKMDSPDQRLFDHYSNSADIFISVSSEFAIARSISIAPSLTFSKRESSYNVSYDDIFGYSGPVYYSLNSNYELKWLDIPIPIKVYTSIKSSKLFIMLGPYVSYGLSGRKSETEYDFGNTTYSSQNIWSSNENILKRIDYGISGGIGLEFFEFFNLSYTINRGLANLSTPLNKSSKVKTRSHGLSFGFKVPIIKKDDSKKP